MERIIKFRAWNEDDKEMYDDVFLSQKIPEGQKGFLKGLGLNEHIQDASKSFILMQFTGLADKNGKDVSHSDVLLLPDTESEYVDVGIGEVKVAEQEIGTLAQVVEQDYSWGVLIKENTETYEAGFISFKELKELVGLDELEVIGNIYENPELLKDHQ